MPKITELYKSYQIMGNLELHMLRVTGVAKEICSHISESVDTENILKACLLHDMGNILKFDLSVFPEFLEPQGLAYWQGVKSDFEKKYGKLVHPATVKIAHEIGASERVIELIDAISFNRAKQNWESHDFGHKICAYADMRVAPFSVVSMKERLEDGQKRYAASTFTYVMGSYLKKIETQIFEKCDIRPEDITESVVAEHFDELRNTSL